MTQYIALIHEDDDGCFTVSFPDIPGLVTAGDSIDEAMEEAEEALAFAAEDSDPDATEALKPPRSIEQLRQDPEFIAAAKNATVVTVQFPVDDAG
jgi:predicted RNase H-like HicB family nuclease